MFNKKEELLKWKIRKSAGDVVDSYISTNRFHSPNECIPYFSATYIFITTNKWPLRN